jgi:osmoprotectant transport system ATP-binding protein
LKPVGDKFPKDNMMIRFKKISKILKSRNIIDQVSFDVPHGECVALLGESGCGKSTLVRILLGLIESSSGTIEVGEVILDQHSKIDLRKKIGYVIQTGGLFPHLTARGNVEIAMREKKNKKMINERIAKVAELSHFFLDKLERYPTELSGGERQRVALMRALINDPDILILDEPFGALDPITRVRLQKELKDLFSALKKTAIIVTHDIKEAEYLSDRIVLLRNGKVEQIGSFRDLLVKPKSLFVSEFINSQREVLL